MSPGTKCTSNGGFGQRPVRRFLARRSQARAATATGWSAHFERGLEVRQLAWDSKTEDWISMTLNRFIGAALVLVAIAGAIVAFGVFGPTENSNRTGPVEVYSGE